MGLGLGGCGGFLDTPERGLDLRAALTVPLPGRAAELHPLFRALDIGHPDFQTG